MQKVNCSILVVGMLSSGSSALIDLLREYENIHVIPGEFNDFRAPGLVADQLSLEQSSEFKNEISNQTKLKIRLHLIYHIFPFLSFNLSLLKGINMRFEYTLTRLKQISLLKQLNLKLTSDISFNDKIQWSSKWISEVGKIRNNNKEYVVFNQPLLTVNNTNIWKKVFHPFKLIIVYRNPKDQLAELIKNGKIYETYAANMTLGGVTLETIYGRNRQGAIDFHIEAIQKRYEWIETLKNELSNDNLLLVDFEGLIKNYEEYKSAIENFIGDIKSDKRSEKLYFDPEKAGKSLDIYPHILNDSEKVKLKDLESWYAKTIASNPVIN